MGMAAGRGLLWILLLVVTLITAALVTFLPLGSLPGEFQTDFVNGQWVKLIFILLVLVVLTKRLAPLNQNRNQNRNGRGPTLRYASMFLWRFTTAMVLAVWPPALLAWANAYGVEAERAHDMVVIGSSSVRVPPAVTPIEHILLEEMTTGWKADLAPTDERKHFATRGTCVRIMVREGRLGLDWISDAQPIVCRS